MKRFTILFFAAFPVLIRFTEAAPPNPRPNIILIIADDIRYDSFQQTGGPAWFDAPAIGRIADEGANFHNFYTVYSLCIPARGTIFTGLYPHSNSCIDNASTLPKRVLSLPAVLDSFGYHCGMIGKYHIADAPRPGWEFWFSTIFNIKYTNPFMNYNTLIDTFIGNITDIIIDSSSAYLRRVDTPFFVTIGHLAPHKPVTPQSQYEGLYEGNPMPIPANYGPYAKWFPSFLYDDENEYYHDTTDLIDDLTLYYQGLKGVDENVDSVFSILTDRNLLDNTMIIFIGDNGALYGDHLLNGKGLPYEPSMKVPLFIRYPKWFPQHQDLYNEDFFGLNTDIMPTVLDAAKISLQDLNTHGISLRKLVNGSISRDQFMFEKIKTDPVGQAQTTEDDVTPSLRALRNLNYKYARYHCDHTVEEFFDLNIDPLETTNRIKEPGYQSIIQSMRNSLDSMQVVLNDTIEESIDTVYRQCRLIKFNKNILIPEDTIIFRLSPNPAGNFVTISILPKNEEEIQVSFFNPLGQLMLHQTVKPEGNIMELPMNTLSLPSGIYYAEVRQGLSFSTNILIKE